MVLARAEIRAYYDRFGRKQDSQRFYEDPALDDLVAQARFERADAVLEFGCGTGRFASRILSHSSPLPASYLGLDMSTTMVGLARERLKAFPDRARVIQTDGVVQFPVGDASVDRVIAAYVLDLMADAEIMTFVREAHRVLRPGGRLCLVSLTDGITALSRLVSSAWTLVYRTRAALVGGCRPIHLGRFLDPYRWTLEHERVVVAWGVPSEVIVARAAGAT